MYICFCLNPKSGILGWALVCPPLILALCRAWSPAAWGEVWSGTLRGINTKSPGKEGVGVWRDQSQAGGRTVWHGERNFVVQHCGGDGPRRPPAAFAVDRDWY